MRVPPEGAAVAAPTVGVAGAGVSFVPGAA